MKWLNACFRAYFVTDLLSVTFSWLIHGQFSTIVAIQQVQHIFYIVTWNKGYMAKRGTSLANYWKSPLMRAVNYGPKWTVKITILRNSGNSWRPSVGIFSSLAVKLWLCKSDEKAFSICLRYYHVIKLFNLNVFDRRYKRLIICQQAI